MSELSNCKLRTKARISIVMAFASLMWINDARANLIDSTYGVGTGSFENGSFINNGADYMALAPGSTSINGWTVNGPGDGVDWLTSPIYNANTGVRAVDLQHTTDSSISTAIPTNIGDSYLLTFYAATFAGRDTEGRFSAGSIVNQSFSVVASPILANMTYSQYSMPFVATAKTTTILFEATGGKRSAFGPAIDNVSVTSVPETSTIVLFCLGIPGILYLKRTKPKLQSISGDA